MNLDIVYLVDRPDVVPTLGRWHHDEWASRTPHLALEDRVAGFRARARPSGVPTGFVALSDGVPVGCACLVEHDLDNRQDLSPWLATVLVAPSYRRQGIGSALTVRVTDEARSLGFDTLYLFTFDQERFYSRLGWTLLDRGEYRGAPVTIMVRHLAG
jgi:GNAT superfamily N-acetyltransferase